MNENCKILLLFAIYNLIIVKEISANNSTSSNLINIVPKNDTIKEFNSTLAARNKRCKKKNSLLKIFLKEYIFFLSFMFTQSLWSLWCVL